MRCLFQGDAIGLAEGTGLSMTLFSRTRAGRQRTGVAAFVVLIAAQAGAQTYYERMWPGHPNFMPALNEVSARVRQTKADVDACLEREVKRLASPTSIIERMTEQACRLCTNQRKSANIARNDYFRFMNSTNRSFNGDINADQSTFDKNSFCSTLPAIYAVDLAKERMYAEEAPILKRRQEEALKAALGCFDQTVADYALTTAESASDVSTAAFSKCLVAFRSAADIGISSRYLGARRIEIAEPVIAAMRESAQRRGVSIVVEARARKSVSSPNRALDQGI